MNNAPLVSVIVAAIALLPAVLSADDWPRWRGNHRNGVVAEKSGWNGKHWLDSKPTWKANVGEGASSPLVVDNRVFALGHQDGRHVITCLKADSGQNLWTASYATPKYGRHAEGDEGLYSGPSSTPEFDPATELLYTLGADGDLHCWNTKKQATQVWHRNLYDDYHMPKRAKVGRSGRRDYGYTSSPLVHGEWLLVEVGSPTGTVIAFEKATGKEVWRSEATYVAGHTGGLAPITVEGIPCVAALTFDGLLVVRLDPDHAGETVATYPWMTDFANNIASPAVHDDCVLITSAYNQEAMCKLRITLQGAEKVWQQPTSSKAGTPVIHAGRIYVVWDQLRALNWDTGKILWEGPSVGDAGSCVVTADNKLIVWAKRGDLFLADIAPSDKPEYRELARLSGLAQTDVWPHLTVSGGQIVCRDRLGNLMCFVSAAAERK